MSVRSAALERDRRCSRAWHRREHQQEKKPGFIDRSLIATSRPWCSTASPYESRSRVSVVPFVVARNAARMAARLNAADTIFDVQRACHGLNQHSYPPRSPFHGGNDPG
jgi:hypothetical protein